MVMVSMSPTIKSTSLFANFSAIVTALTLLSSFTCLLMLSSSPATFADSAVDDVRALLEFKKGIKDDPHNKVLGTWNHMAEPESDLGPCPRSFYGVSCGGSSNSVETLILNGLGLSGELKFFTLTGLKGLKILSLSGNNFTGRLVPALGSMSTLVHLDLSHNKFYGPIPPRLHDLYGLNHLNLSLNDFEGWYPSGIRNLNQLKLLDVHSNRLTGNVLSFFSDLQNVEHIDLSHNLFSGGLPIGAESVPSADTLALFRSFLLLCHCLI